MESACFRSFIRFCPSAFLPQHSSDGFVEPPVPPTKSASRHSLPRCRNSLTSTEEHPHIGNYRLLKTIGKGNFAKVKLARHVLTGREVRRWGDPVEPGMR